MKSFFPFLLIFLIAFAMFLPQFLIKVKVRCESQYGECPFEINSRLQTLNSRNLLQAKQGIKDILKDDLLILDHSVQFKLPDILEVNLLVKKPAFAFQDKLSGKIYIVDEKGTVLSEKADTSLPLLIQEGTRVDLFPLKLMAGVFAMYQVRRGEITGTSLVVELPGSLRVIFPLEGTEPDVLLGSLRLIYSQIQNDPEQKYSEIDLRFKNPVLR